MKFIGKPLSVSMPCRNCFFIYLLNGIEVKIRDLYDVAIYISIIVMVPVLLSDTCMFAHIEHKFSHIEYRSLSIKSTPWLNKFSFLLSVTWRP